MVDIVFKTFLDKNYIEVKWILSKKYRIKDRLIMVLINPTDYYIIPVQVLLNGTIKVNYKKVTPDTYYLIIYKNLTFDI